MKGEKMKENREGWAEREARGRRGCTPAASREVYRGEAAVPSKKREARQGARGKEETRRRGNF